MSHTILKRIFTIALLVISASTLASATTHYYGVIFGITIDQSGALQSLQVIKVIEPQTKSDAAVDIAVPPEYIEAARKLIIAKHYPVNIKDGKPVEFFTYFFYDPARPSRADIDPHND